MSDEAFLIFDMDGVLNTLTARHGADFGRKHNYARLICQVCVGNFNRIVDATGCRLVVSSSWRNLIHNGHMDLLGFGAMLRSHGIHGELVGTTPQNPDDEPRWRQICRWLRDNPRPISVARKICVLDDDPDAFGYGPDGRKPLYPGVQTSSAVGLTEADAAQAIDILS